MCACLPSILPIWIYCIVAVGRQRLIKNWDEENFVETHISVGIKPCCIVKLQVLVLRERQVFDHLAVE